MDSDDLFIPEAWIRQFVSRSREHLFSNFSAPYGEKSDENTNRSISAPSVDARRSTNEKIELPEVDLKNS